MGLEARETPAVGKIFSLDFPLYRTTYEMLFCNPFILIFIQMIGGWAYISAKIRNQFVVFVCDGVRSGLRRFGSNSATPLAAAPLGAALRLPGGMQTETHATGCGFSVSGKE